MVIPTEGPSDDPKWSGGSKVSFSKTSKLWKFSPKFIFDNYFSQFSLIWTKSQSLNGGWVMDDSLSIHEKREVTHSSIVSHPMSHFRWRFFENSFLAHAPNTFKWKIIQVGSMAARTELQRTVSFKFQIKVQIESKTDQTEHFRMSGPGNKGWQTDLCCISYAFKYEVSVPLKSFSHS